MMRAFVIALRLELMSILRMRETYTFGILPAVLAVPVTAALVLVAMSFTSENTLAIPQDDPAGLDVERLLERQHDVVRTDDPRGLVESGAADIAVLYWSLRDNLDTAWLDVAVVRSPDSSLSDLEDALEDALEDQIDQQITEAGGVAIVDRKVARVIEASTPDDWEIDERQGFWIWFIVLTSYLGCFLIPVRTTVERLSGALEAMAVTATPVWVVYMARLLVTTPVVILIAATPVVVMWLLVNDIPGLPIQPLDAVETGFTILLINALFLVCGLVASSLYLGSYFILVMLPFMAIPVGWPVVQVPLLGLLCDAGWVFQSGRIAGTLMLVGLTLAFVGGLARGERVLPPGEGDE